MLLITKPKQVNSYKSGLKGLYTFDQTGALNIYQLIENGIIDFNHNSIINHNFERDLDGEKYFEFAQIDPQTQELNGIARFFDKNGDITECVYENDEINGFCRKVYKYGSYTLFWMENSEPMGYIKEFSPQFELLLEGFNEDGEDVSPTTSNELFLEQESKMADHEKYFTKLESGSSCTIF